MKTVNIQFCGFWNGFDKTNNPVYNILKKRYDVKLTNTPDFLFYSNNGGAEKFKNCVKIFLTGENMIPNFNECDFGQAFAYIDFGMRYFRKPFIVNESINNRSEVSKDLLNRKFCNFIYSNSSWPGTKVRDNFCTFLQKYKKVDCPGKSLHNIDCPDLSPRFGNWYSSKLNFLKNYKFTIAFENSFSDGYTTEKLAQPFYSLSVPIYWGNPLVTKDYNPKAFINCNDYENDFSAVIERVKELDNDDKQYLSMLSEKPMQEDYDFDIFKKFAEWIYFIVERGNKPFDKGICFNGKR